ncbi:MAG: Flp pilus assembly complex ATPase component TadA, partial [Coleofasciculus sp. Co-bin14]|nr:Flp pilus assembly complex ATPase component TadA [Coleofasciculus sp. Co-bin14]
MTQSSSPRRALIVRNDVSPFGNKLIAAGYVDNEQMQQALVETRKTGRPITEIIESMAGRQLSPDLLRQYKKQQLFELKVLYGVESLDPEISEINSHQVGKLIDTLIPIDICSRYRLLPIAKKETQPPSVLVAMVDPDNLDAQDDLNRILRPQGIALQRMVITQEDYQQLISRYRDDKLERDRKEEFEKAVDVKQDLETLENLDTLSDAPDEVEEVDIKSGDIDAPVINLVNRILAKALSEGASDIHVEPQENDLRIRFRKDGVLHHAFDPLPKKIMPAVAARFKIMAELDIAERRLPQDGKIRRMFQGR